MNRSTMTWFVCVLLSLCTLPVAAQVPDETKDARPRIQLAMLLDTSNSMDGLIEQAKSQLWKIVNSLNNAKRDGIVPELQVSLYEYGNNKLPASGGHIRCVVPLSSDLDLLSEQLFALRTDGGQEYCGAVIERAVTDLLWSSAPNDLRLIVIAGNEPFSQGSVDYHTACRAALRKNILVNTIHCGDGIPGDWLDGAAIGGGRAFSINQNRRIEQFTAPQDAEISKLSAELNTTYLAYGRSGHANAYRQMTVDRDQVAESVISRALTKANAHYSCPGWDLVDAVREKKVDLAKLRTEDFPESMRKMSFTERVAHVAAMAKRRVEIQARINQLNAERETSLAAQRKAANQGDKTLDTALIESLRDLAIRKGFHFGS